MLLRKLSGKLHSFKGNISKNIQLSPKTVFEIRHNTICTLLRVLIHHLLLKLVKFLSKITTLSQPFLFLWGRTIYILVALTIIVLLFIEWLNESIDFQNQHKNLTK